MRLGFRTPASVADREFVISTWLDASRTSYSSGLIQMDDWYPTMWPQYEKALAREGMVTSIAYEVDDPEFTYGWIAADPSEQRVPGKDGSVTWWPALVLFVFVKQNFRREGVARQLFRSVNVDPAKPFVFACNTKTASRLSSKVPLARFNPLVSRYPKETP